MRILFGGLTLVVVLLVGALIAPQFVDWNKYKPQIISQVQKATGLDIDVAGNLSMAVLPMPHVKIEDLTVIAPKQKEFKNLLKMKSVEVSVELLPLLQKEIKVSRVTLVEPDIKVEIMADGTPSWQTEKLTNAAQKNKTLPNEEVEQPKTQVSSHNKLESIALEKLEIKGGKLDFINHQSGARYTANDMNAKVKANSLKGPFEGQGDLIYNDNKIEFDISSGEIPKEGVMPLRAEISVPNAGAIVTFDGVASLTAPLDIQGKTMAKAQSIAKLMSVVNSESDISITEDFMIEGILSANENRIQFDDLKVKTSDFVGHGNLFVENLKNNNPLLLAGKIQSENVLNLNPFLKKSNKNKAEKPVKPSSKASSNNNEIIPKTLILPMPIDVDLNINVAGLRFQKNNLQGVDLALAKKDGAIKSIFKVNEMSGKANASGMLSINYASSSKSAKTGQAIYSDPTVSYKVEGKIGQLAAFLNEFAPQAETKAITNLYSNAQFNLDGSIKNGTIQLKESTVKMNDLVLALAGSYKPQTSLNRAKAVIDVRADALNFDNFTDADSSKKISETDNGNSNLNVSKDKSKALDPIRNLSLPMDVDFDVSVQKARINSSDLSGLRAKGKVRSNALTFDTLSVNNFGGATLSLKGNVADLKNLSGLDLTAYIKTDDLKSFANNLKIDTTKIPTSINKLEATIEGKGAIENITFSSNVKALGGQVDANGQVTNILQTPSFDGLALRIKHPNANNAIKSFSADFKGSDSLNQSVDLYSKVNSNGKIYNLLDINAKLGISDFTGNLKIDMSNKITGISGDIKAGKIALDSLLGSKSSGGASPSKNSAKTTSSNASNEKWSNAPINLSWMNSNNINVNLSAQNITYGKWNFANPSTDLKIANGVMKINGLKADVFGGNATINTTVNAKPVSIAMDSTMNGINIEQLVTALSNSNKLKAKGDVSFNIDVNATGESSRALISNLNGSSNIDGKNIIIEGFDFAKLAQGLSTEQKFATSLQNFASGALRGGQTQFDTLDGDYAINNGIVSITKMVLDGPSSIINSTGQADLPKWYININNEVSLKNVEDFDPINIQIKGSISNPSTFGKDILQDYIQQKLQRKLGKELPDILGNDVTEKLQKFGILPQTQKAVDSAPKEDFGLSDIIKQEANDNTPNTSEKEEVKPEPVQEEPKKIETPEDAVQQLLNSDNPEDAVNNLIKGLF